MRFARCATAASSMSSGRKIAEGATADVLNDAAVVKAYLGGVAADA